MRRTTLFIAVGIATVAFNLQAVAWEAPTKLDKAQTEPEKTQASPDKVTARLYGFVRGDMSYLSRRNFMYREGTFVYFPLDYEPDVSGYDLNAVSNFGFYSICSRLGVEIEGGRVFGADLSGKIEGDFGGFNATFGANATVMRIRHAYMHLNWRHSDLILGQTYHPMIASFRVDVLTMAMGAPFTASNRAPQMRFNYNAGDFTFSGAMIWQLQSVSRGPDGGLNIYQKESATPEFFLGAKYSRDGVTVGAEASRLEIAPRTQSTVGTDVFRVHERLASYSWGGYARYESGLFSIVAKSYLDQNLAHVSLLGGYGVSSIDPVTGRQEYTNFNYWTSLLSASYGKKYRVGLFGGWSRNMGTQKPLVDDNLIWGNGVGGNGTEGFNSLTRVTTNFSYNLAFFTLGAEYEWTLAKYGDPGSRNLASGRYASTHNVINHRLSAVVIYSF